VAACGPPRKPTTSKNTNARARHKGGTFSPARRTRSKAADTAGFHYKYDPITKQFAPRQRHHGLDARRKDRPDIFTESSTSPETSGWAWWRPRKIKSVTSPIKVLLFCYHYDPMTGKYGAVIQNVTNVLGSATVLALGALVFVLIKRGTDSERGRPA